MKKNPHIAIIGAGFSGTLLSFHLAKEPIKVTLIEKGPIAKGIAYGTTNPFHYLNVKAANMSALAVDSSHFLTWLKNNKDLWQILHPSFSTLEISPNSYLPRMIYGAYLQWLAENNHAEIIKKEAIAITQDLTITFNDNSTLMPDVIVLACGVPDNKSFAIKHKNFTQNIWKPHSESILFKKNCDSPIALIGSGLTMLDALATLENNNFLGSITVISNDGRLPEAHRELPSCAETFFQGTPSSAHNLLKMIRLSVHEAALKGYDWRYVIDELRPKTQLLWQLLAQKEKKRLLPLLSLWNRHRHRMPSQYIELLERIKKKNFFQHIAGSLQEVQPKENGFTLALKDRTVFAEHVLNCSGPELRLDRNASPLIQSLRQNEMIKPDEINRGIFVDKDDSAIGKAQGSLFVLGQLLFGTKLEITAVPELREGSYKLANHLRKKFIRDQI